MKGFLSSSMVWPSPITTLGLDLALRVTALLVSTLTLDTILGPRRSLIRSALWHASLVGLLILPLASFATPRLRIACLPTASGRASARRPETPLVPPAPRLAESDAPGVDEVRVNGPENGVRSSAALPDTAPANRAWRPDRVGVLALGYGAGATLLLLRLIGSLAAVVRLRRGCVVVEGPVWRERLERWQARLEIAGRVELLATDRLAVPVVVGWRHPAIVLPASLAGSTAPERLDSVLIHELAHVRRADYAWNILLRVAQVVYWPHPLLWISGWVMNRVRERACDDFCIATLPDRAAYRDTLLELAQGLVRRPGPALGLAMARVSKLGNRLAWIARSAGDSRCQMGGRGRAAFFGSIIAAVFLLAAIELTRASAEPPPAVQEPASKAAPAPQAPAQAIDFRVVRDEDKLPVAGAIVEVNMYRGRGKESHYTTDAEGRCRITLPAETPAAVTVTVASPGYVPLEVVWTARELTPGADLSYTLTLCRGGSAGGLVQDEQGRPIAGVNVRLQYRGRLAGDGKATFARTSAPVATTDAQGRWRADVLPAEARPNDRVILYLAHPDHVSDLEMPSRDVRVDKARTGEDVQVMKAGAPVAGTILDAAGRPVEGAAVMLAYGWSNIQWRESQSDARGEFRFDHVDETETAQFGPLAVLVEAAGFAPVVRELAAKPQQPRVEIRLEAGRPLSGRVVDSNGNPMGGAAVRFQSYKSRNGWTWMGSTDADGRFLWPDGPVAGQVTLRVSKAPYKELIGQDVAAGARDATMTLFGPQRLRGTVVDAETGAPIDVFTLIPGWGSGQPRQPVIWLGRGRARKRTGGHFDEMGMFTSGGTSLWLRVQADGYLVDTAPPFSDADAEVTFTFKLRKGAGLSGIVRGPDGAPVGGADVCLANQGEYITLHNGDLSVGGRADSLGVHATTGPDGRYRLGPTAEPSGLLVVHDRGFARLSAEEVAKSADVQLQPWGRIVGTLAIGAQPGALQPVGAYVLGPMGREGREEMYRYSATTDSKGGFAWDRVAPGEVTVHRVFTDPSGNGTSWSHLAHVTVRPGAAVAVALGGGGRPVVGRVVGPGGTAPVPLLVSRNSTLSVKLPPPPTPADFASFSQEHKRQWLADFRKTEAGRAKERRTNRVVVVFDRDGTFRAEDVPPGTYDLRVVLGGLEPGRATRIATGGKEVIVPEGPADQPFDVGRVELEFRNFRTLNVNDAVPALSARTLDDKPLALSTYRGKYVLLDFWATWCGSCLEETPFLKATFDAFSKDERFVMISLSLDQRVEAPKKHSLEHALNWTQGFLGIDPPSPVTEDFGVTSVSQVMLIGPDGKLIAKDLHGERIKAAVNAALGQRK